MSAFRKKSVVIKATQWFTFGDRPGAVQHFKHLNIEGANPCPQCHKPLQDHGWIDTLEGGHRVCPGDWIITGVKGERYPCKPDIFESTYEPV
jgi:hypothetical protein